MLPVQMNILFHWLEVMYAWIFRLYDMNLASQATLPANALSVVESAVAPISITAIAATITRYLVFMLYALNPTKVYLYYALT
jgi:hypothetical protein